MDWLIFAHEQPQVAPDTKMKLNQKLLAQIESDLGLNVPFVKGRIIKIKNCWHFSTDGNAVDARGGSISFLSIPLQEMRQHKNEVCKERFGKQSVKGLSTEQRLRLARTLRARYNSSLKQIARLSGLVYYEVKDRF